MQADAAEPDIGSERDITRLGESVVKVSIEAAQPCAHQTQKVGKPSCP